MRKYIYAAAGLGGLAIVAALAFIYSGAYNVAASERDPAWIRWILHTTMERSVEAHAEGIKPPAEIALNDPGVIRHGFEHYNEMCIACHGAPGVRPGEAHAGLNPQPPNLAVHAKEMSPGELFWVVKHGVRMTGMPAWGPTHSDDRIWAIVAFLKTLPGMTAEQYAAMRRESKGGAHADNDH